MVEGTKVFFLKDKLKMLRYKLRRSNIEVFGWIDLKIDNVVKELNQENSFLKVPREGF